MLVVVSPHGRGSGVYRAATGSLDSLGIAGIRIENEPAPTAKELAQGWKGWLEGEADFGVAVPLVTAGTGDGEVVACAFGEATGPYASDVGDANGLASALVSAIGTVAESRRVGVIASGHTSAALSARAPLTERPGARELDDRIVAALAESPVALLDVDESAWAAGDPCGRLPLLLLAHLFGHRGGNVVARASPFGVGYVAAAWELE